MRRPICNGKSETAPHIYGHTFVLCWRCTGGVLGLALYLLFEKIFVDLMGIIHFFFVPAVIDFYLNKYKMKKPNNKLRFVTGVMLGMSLGSIEMLLIKFLL